MCERKHAPKLDFSEPTTTVTVGEHKTPFHIHKEVLATSSKWFEAAFRPEWNNVDAPLLHISDASVETFSQYARWAYSGQVVVGDPDENTTSKMEQLYGASAEERETWVQEQYESLLSLAIFGDQKMSIGLTNDIVDAMLKLSDNAFELNQPFRAVAMLPSTSTILRAYASLPSGCPIRKVLVHLIAHAYSFDQLKKAAQLWLPTEMVMDLMLAYREVLGKRTHGRLPKRPSRDIDCGPCRFHEHGNEESDEQIKTGAKRVNEEGFNTDSDKNLEFGLFD